MSTVRYENNAIPNASNAWKACAVLEACSIIAWWHSCCPTCVSSNHAVQAGHGHLAGPFSNGHFGKCSLLPWSSSEHAACWSMIAAWHAADGPWCCNCRQPAACPQLRHRARRTMRCPASSSRLARPARCAQPVLRAQTQGPKGTPQTLSSNPDDEVPGFELKAGPPGSGAPGLSWGTDVMLGCACDCAQENTIRTRQGHDLCACSPAST